MCIESFHMQSGVQDIVEPATKLFFRLTKAKLV
jgi:hypothetical protein